MNIIIPMAGAGKRMRPHTLSTPKPLIPVAGKPIVQRLVEDIAEMSSDKIEQIAFVIGDFGKAAEAHLLQVAESVGAKGIICYQDEPLGTAHAILCAQQVLKGNVIIAFADTLFYADFKIDESKDGIIWVNRIPDPSSFGVVVLDGKNTIKEFVEKPQEFISDLAIIGIYYFKDGENLRKELQYLIDNDLKYKGEYQITTAMENMLKKGSKFTTAEVIEWLDCGNKDATVYTNQRVLELNHKKNKNLVSPTAVFENSIMIPPCMVGDKAVIKNSVIGPHASIGSFTKIEDSIIKNSIIQTNTVIKNRVIQNSMVGHYVSLSRKPDEVSIGDYTTEQ